MASLKCVDCDLAWPADLREYERCPSCLGRTRWSHGGDPLDPSIATSMKRHYDFERFCIERDARRGAEQLFEELEQILALGTEHLDPNDEDMVCSD